MRGIIMAAVKNVEQFTKEFTFLLQSNKVKQIALAIISEKDTSFKASCQEIKALLNLFEQIEEYCQTHFFAFDKKTVYHIIDLIFSKKELENKYYNQIKKMFEEFYIIFTLKKTLLDKWNTIHDLFGSFYSHPVEFFNSVLNYNITFVEYCTKANIEYTADFRNRVTLTLLCSSAFYDLSIAKVHNDHIKFFALLVSHNLNFNLFQDFLKDNTVYKSFISHFGNNELEFLQTALNLYIHNVGAITGQIFQFLFSKEGNPSQAKLYEQYCLSSENAEASDLRITQSFCHHFWQKILPGLLWRSLFETKISELIVTLDKAKEKFRNKIEKEKANPSPPVHVLTMLGLKEDNPLFVPKIFWKDYEKLIHDYLKKLYEKTSELLKSQNNLIIKNLKKFSTHIEELNNLIVQLHLYERNDLFVTIWKSPEDIVYTKNRNTLYCYPEKNNWIIRFNEESFSKNVPLYSFSPSDENYKLFPALSGLSQQPCHPDKSLILSVDAQRKIVNKLGNIPYTIEENDERIKNYLSIIKGSEHSFGKELTSSLNALIFFFQKMNHIHDEKKHGNEKDKQTQTTQLNLFKTPPQKKNFVPQYTNKELFLENVY